MTTLQIELPNTTANAVCAAGLLTRQALEHMVVKELLDGMLLKHQARR